MNFVAKCIVVVVLVSLWVSGCKQSRKKEADLPDQVKVDFVTLDKSTYQVGDSIPVRLNQPLSQVTVSWDGKPAISQSPVNNIFPLESVDLSIGLHQLVVNALTVDKEKLTDTLSIELWSNIKPEKLSYSVLKTYPHQASSFTQGLEFHQDTLYEGTGLVGQSKLMKVDLLTGSILQSVSLPAPHFGEGITVVKNHIYQLTWTSGQCFQYSMNMTLEKTHTYHSQGWGLTHRDSTLIVSDGSNRLSFYTPSFQKTDELMVYDDKGPLMNLNELEYIDGYVLANVWQTNRIVQIDLKSGKVIGELTIDPALPPGVDTKENVLNGIAYRSKEAVLYITGKNWPILYKLKVNGLFKLKKKTTIASR
ncbi:glutaminyl-peptide cyclotransferase (plasmid) [Fibrella sp. ES10-3-2-2]